MKDLPPEFKIAVWMLFFAATLLGAFGCQPTAPAPEPPAYQPTHAAVQGDPCYYAKLDGCGWVAVHRPEPVIKVKKRHLQIHWESPADSLGGQK